MAVVLFMRYINTLGIYSFQSPLKHQDKLFTPFIVSYDICRPHSDTHHNPTSSSCHRQGDEKQLISYVWLSNDSNARMCSVIEGRQWVVKEKSKRGKEKWERERDSEDDEEDLLENEAVCHTDCILNTSVVCSAQEDLSQVHTAPQAKICLHTPMHSAYY